MSARGKERLTAARWDSLAPELRTPQQVAGRAYVACGATHGVMEACNYACTACYLSDLAQRTRPAPFEEVQQQLVTLREQLGPGGKVQITSGEVTLLPLERLGRIVAYAREIGLDPMVFTNGERFTDDPSYLERLVREYGLEKVSIHVDATQRGRRGYRQGADETTLHAVRDHYAGMIRDVRRRTGRTLHAAHTVTVTADNLDDVPGIVAWMLDNVDAFRMVSFQPVAEVGRTRDRRDDGHDADDLWARVGHGVGRRLNRHAMHFGHPDCNIVCPLIVVSCGGRHAVIESVREGHRFDLWTMRRVIETFGGMRRVGSSLRHRITRNVRAALSSPDLLAAAPVYALYRLWGERRWLPRLVLNLLRLRLPQIRPLAIIVHRFMSPDELDTARGRERLEACTFKLPVDGQLVSMCTMNASGLRRELDAGRLAQELPPRERSVP